MDKMKTYATQEGELISVPTAIDVVTCLRMTTTFPIDTNEEYMDDVAARIKAMSGKIVRTDNADDFVADLVDAEFLKEV